jgi:hypothetical protein
MSKSSHNGRRPSLLTGEKSVPTDQPDLFQCLDQPATPSAGADLDIGPELLGAINTALRLARGRGLSRERVVDAMNRLLPDLDKPLTVRQLNGWTAASDEFREFPARFLPAFCSATDCDLPLTVLAQAIARELVDSREAAAKRLGEHHIQMARLKRELRALQQELGQ